MKKFAIAMALGATVAAAGSASASEQRPSYIAFKPSSSASVAAPGATPAGPSVAKRSNLKGAIVIPLAVVAIGGGIALAVSGGGGDGSPN